MDAFRRDAGRCDGRETRCKACRKQYRLDNLEKFRARERANLEKARKPKVEKACETCGAKIVTSSSRQRFCSQRCWAKAARKRWPEDNWTPRRKANYQKRRALKRTQDAERILLGEVHERDRGRCGLCGKRVDRRKPYPHPLSASLDHILPLSEGGAHVLANVQLAHLRCNIAKGARGNDQLRLVG